MLRPLDSANRSTDLVYDVCVIGAGAAGLTISTQLARRGFSVMLAEGGDLKASVDSLQLYQGDVIGDRYFDLRSTRLRYFGGTTGHWGGWCRELDPVDFEAKAGIPSSAWPIEHADLAGYAPAAADILEIPTQRGDRPLDGNFKEVFFRFSPPVRFGEKYRAQVAGDGNIDAFLNCNLTELRFDGERITSAEFSNFDNLRVTVGAKHFVLACGGIENSRILLNENERYGGRLGNRSGLVGRYWSEHNVFTLGEFMLFDDRAFETGSISNRSGTESRRIFVAPTRQFMDTRGVLNCGLRLLPLYKRQGAKKFVATIMCTTPRMSNAILGMFGDRIVCAGRIRAAWEQMPNSDNRVALSAAKDRFGNSRCNLYWKKSMDDKITARACARALGVYLAEQDIGRIRLAEWLVDDSAEFPEDDEIGGNHHMGGTRMADTPDSGVVDADCRVFGTSNLHVAGSSVFPSGGHANPTLTIVQLALRLADHLSQELRL